MALKDNLPGKLGFGSAPLGTMFRDIPEAEARAVRRLVRLGVLAASLGAAFIAGASLAGPAANIIPAPMIAQPSTASPVRISDGSMIVVPKGDKGARRIGTWLKDLAWRTRRIKLTLANQSTEGRSAIIFQRGDAASRESYDLAVGDGRVMVTAGAETSSQCASKAGIT